MSLLELFILFAKVNLLSFGGPSIGISMLESELVEKRKILTQEQMDKIFVTTNIVPGPVFLQLSILIGYEIKKLWGFIICLLTSITLVPMLSIFIYFFLSNIIPQSKFDEFVVLMAPVTILILLNFIWKTLLKSSKQMNIFVLIFELICSLILLIVFKIALFPTLLITLVFVFFINQFLIKIVKVK